MIHVLYLRVPPPHIIIIIIKRDVCFSLQCLEQTVVSLNK
jgi:hypothetical protein